MTSNLTGSMKRKVLACWWPTVVHSWLPSAVLACRCCSSRISVHCTPMHVCTVYCTQWCTHCACACVLHTVCRMPASSCGLCAVCFPLRPGNKKRNLPVEPYYYVYTLTTSQAIRCKVSKAERRHRLRNNWICVGIFYMDNAEKYCKNWNDPLSTTKYWVARLPGNWKRLSFCQPWSRW